MKKQVVNMLYPFELIDRIDKIKAEKGFTTRTQAIIFLIQYALEQLEKTKMKSDRFTVK